MAIRNAGIRARPRPAGNFELFSWYFMRVSGAVLLFMVLGHLGIMHVFGSVENVDTAFVTRRLTNPLWRTYDLTMIVLAMLHGANGGRWIIEDYVSSRRARLVWLSLLYTLVFVFLLLGSLILLTFQPQLAQPAELSRMIGL